MAEEQLMNELYNSEIHEGEFHPAARSAYRWLKGFMISNANEYAEMKSAIAVAALGKNRQAQICYGTIVRLMKGQPVSDRYLLGLCWTILQLSNSAEFNVITEQRWDRAYEPDDSEIKGLRA